MSVPASVGGAVIPLVALSPIDSVLQMFNTNPYFIGLTMLLMNLGGRFLTLDVTKKQEQFLQHPWVRRSLIFIVIFIGTRNIWVAFWATLLVVLLMGYLFNENSALCIFGKGGANGATCTGDTPIDTKKEALSPEEKEILMRLQSKAQRLQPVAVEKVADVHHGHVYAANMNLLRR
jgi:hypothetical protein